MAEMKTKKNAAEGQFSEKVYKLTKRIPEGKITTYKEIAKALKTRAYRAVGNALNKNPSPIVVPCHRVVKSDGRVGGFALGANNKIQLLRKEGIRIKNSRIVDFEKKLFRF